MECGLLGVGIPPSPQARSLHCGGFQGGDLSVPPVSPMGPGYYLLSTLFVNAAKMKLLHVNFSLVRIKNDAIVG